MMQQDLDTVAQKAADYFRLASVQGK
jgi:hypothetical protein